MNILVYKIVDFNKVYKFFPTQFLIKCILCLLSGEMASNVLRLAKEARQRALGPFSPSFNVQEILIESLQKVGKQYMLISLLELINKKLYDFL